MSSSLVMSVTQIPTISPREQLEHDLLRRSQRKVHAAPIRHSFVQGGTQRAPLPGPLARFTSTGAHRPLDCYLLMVALATGEPYNVVRDAGVWIRLLGLPQGRNDSAIMTKAWRWLADNDLIERSRRGRQSAPMLLREDGSGDAYTRPVGHGDPYFRLPFDFWLGEDDDEPPYRVLSLAAKAMLLIALSRSKRTFPLKIARVPAWYGISEDTASKGLKELCDHDFLTVDRRHVRDLNSGIGWRTDPFYTRLWPKRTSPK